MEIKLLISVTMTTRDVAALCLEHLALNEDPKCYVIVIAKKDQNGKHLPSSVHVAQT